MSAEHTPGPYWVRTTTNGRHQVCGRNGRTIREYMPDQVEMAYADCRKLQAGFTKAEKALSDAAPYLYEALQAIAHLRPGGDVNTCSAPRRLVEQMERLALNALAKVTAA